MSILTSSGIPETNNIQIFRQSTITNVSTVGCGMGFTMVVKNDGTLWGCGLNDEYELGTGDDERTYTYVKITKSRISAVQRGQLVDER